MASISAIVSATDLRFLLLPFPTLPEEKYEGGGKHGVGCEWP